MPEEDFKQLLDLEKDNNRLLRRLVNNLRWQHYYTILRWAIFIGVLIGSWYYLQPYLDTVFKAYGQLQNIKYPAL